MAQATLNKDVSPLTAKAQVVWGFVCCVAAPAAVVVLGTFAAYLFANFIGL